MLNEKGFSNLVQNMGHKGPVLMPRHFGPGRARNQIPFNSIDTQNIKIVDASFNVMSQFRFVEKILMN